MPHKSYEDRLVELEHEIASLNGKLNDALCRLANTEGQLLGLRACLPLRFPEPALIQGGNTTPLTPAQTAWQFAADNGGTAYEAKMAAQAALPTTDHEERLDDYLADVAPDAPHA
jgi:hypothetical protein